MGKKSGKRRGTGTTSAPAAPAASVPSQCTGHSHSSGGPGAVVLPSQPSEVTDALAILRLKYTLLGKSEWWWVFDDVLALIAAALDSHMHVALDGFLGNDLAPAMRREIEAAYMAGRLPETAHSMVGCPRLQKGALAGAHGSADISYQMDQVRGDYVAWFNGREEGCNWKVLPVLLQRLDTLVDQLSEIMPELKQIKSRSNAMMTCYPGEGAHYIRHCDNTSTIRNGRKLTVLYYANPQWSTADGGELRVFEQALTVKGEKADTPMKRDIAPLGDRVVVFWSDTRVPHAVLPSSTRRYAITTWYMDEEERVAFRDLENDPKVMEAKKERIKEEIRKFEEKHGVKAKVLETESSREPDNPSCSETEVLPVAAQLSLTDPHVAGHQELGSTVFGSAGNPLLENSARVEFFDQMD